MHVNNTYDVLYFHFETLMKGLWGLQIRFETCRKGLSGLFGWLVGSADLQRLGKFLSFLNVSLTSVML